MIAVYATLAGVALAVALLVVVKVTGQSRLSGGLATAAGAVCLVAFVLINVSDWPGGFLNQFWLSHAIVGATAGTLLLAATVFLVYRYRDQQQQTLIDESIVDAGRAELVERLVDVDVALSLVCRDSKPDLCQGERWQRPPRGLEWLRENLSDLDTVGDSYWAQRDPRLWSRAAHVHREDWRLPLLEQMVGRVTRGVRGWGPILMRSRQGSEDLVAFANVRLVLLELDRQVRLNGGMDTTAARELQHWVHRLALLLEADGLTPEPRTKLFVPPLHAAPPLPRAVSTDEVVRPLLDRIQRHVERRTRLVKSGKPWRSSAAPASVLPAVAQRPSSS